MSAREELAADQRREFGSSWDEMVYTEGRTLGWIIESVIEDVLASPALARVIREREFEVIKAANLRAIKHEIETPSRGHRECCGDHPKEQP